MKNSLSHYFFWSLNYSFLPPRLGVFQKIDSEISALHGITKGRHLFGSIEWRYKNRPIGHIHGNTIVDILFPKETKNLLIQQGRVQRHKYIKSGISLHIKSQSDVMLAIDLLKKSYQIIKEK
ncbi:luciferase family protein [Flagellimonas sp. S3867]|uniref:luciferase domain-containing protein n=1 Tax=Flagellimonas sp. S3867 TaxID=2768063 RepID=UPI0016859D98|nr:luciferase family protein [Flagellimonas sp. S3867]